MFPKCGRFSWRDIWNNITLEPMLICYLLPGMLMVLGVENLNLEKACRVNLNYNQTVCDALRLRDIEYYKEQEKEVQKLVAQLTGWKTAINSALPCLMIVFFGSWSDRHGKRKPSILIPLCGQTITSALLLLCVYFDRTPIEWTIFVEVFFPAITGSGFTMMAGVFSYMADITNEKNRTVRIGIVYMASFLCVPMGMAVSGIMLKNFGFYGVFSVVVCLYTISLLYGCFILKEVPPKEMTEKLVKKSFLADFFDFRHIKDTIMVAFKARANNDRLKILMLLTIIIIVAGPGAGEASLSYFLTRTKFNWSEVEYSFFSTYSMAIHLFGTFVTLLLSMYKLDDAIIGLMVCISRFLACLVYAFSQVDWQFHYIGPAVGFITGALLTSMRSLGSKTVTHDEVGKLNSLYGIIECIVPLIYSPLYAAVYTATLTKMPGAFFLISALLTIPGALLFICIYRMNHSEAKEKESADNPPPYSEVVVAEDKLCDMYLQNEGLSLMHDTKGLYKRQKSIM